ncbi:MAG TPA: MFS transporter [Rariglobus sp.]|jgi:fucose permease|nr:MFS transporter [Rariglobus sp.]
MKKSLFTTADGTNHLVTFILVSSLFLLWGFCNGMIDVMDKHFQDQLHLSKAQSAWVQFAHYMGYALMALPAGLLTRRLGYRGGIIAGLLLVSLGGFWFLPATSISQFWAFLLGVCIIAMGLTILETVANPYTTVLGPKEYGASRINLAQSCNGVGWILGPIVGSMYFYSEGGVQKAHGQLFIPYLGVGIVVIILAALFLRAPVPEIHVPDEYHTDDNAPVTEAKQPFLSGLMMFLNVAAVGLSVYLVLHTILPACGIGEHTVETKWWLFALPVLLTAPFVFTAARKLSTHSIWAHPHFSGAIIAQFLYVAAQAGIFSFFINSMTVDKNNGYCMVPTLPASVDSGMFQRNHWIEHRVYLAPADITDLSALVTALKEKSGPVATFLADNLSPDTQKQLADGTAPTVLQSAMVADLNTILRQGLSPTDSKPALYDASRFSAVTLGPTTQKLLTAHPEDDNNRMRLNRMLLADAFPKALAYDDTRFAVSDKGASLLSSFAFGFFLLGRLIGASLMRKTAAHLTLGIFALVNIGVCGLIIAKLGWISVLGVFLSYLFMSIMYPTIFALGIFGLGSQSKKKAAAFIVMSITGGALMPKFMGHLGDIYNMSASFWMPLACFVFIACYGFFWRSLSRSDGDVGLPTQGGH